MIPHSTSPLLTIVLILQSEVVGDHETHAGVDPLELLPRLLEFNGPVGSFVSLICSVL